MLSSREVEDEYKAPSVVETEIFTAYLIMKLNTAKYRKRIAYDKRTQTIFSLQNEPS